MEVSVRKAAIKAGAILIISGLLAGWVWAGQSQPTIVSSKAGESKLAIIPFKVNADRDLSFLQNGILDMLSSRLSHPGVVAVMDQKAVASALATITGGIDETSAREIGIRLDADQVLFGSITSIGEGISVDTHVMPIRGSDAAKPFYIQADTMGEVIPKISQLTETINQQVFGLGMKAQTPQTVPVAPQATHRANPEKVFIEEQAAASSALRPSQPPTDAGETTDQPFIQSIQPQAGQFWRSQTFKFPINGMALGDVDGDGRNEMVIVSDHRLYLYRYQSGRLVKVSETKKDRNRYYIGVDTADINGNGRPEIFISALNIQKNRVRSQILETDGLTYDTLISDSPWYYRVSESPGQNPILLGQKALDEDPYKAAVYELQWNGSDYEPGQRVTPKKRANALGCVIGDLQNNGTKTVAAFSENDTLQIFDEKGELIGSSNGYGGNLLAANLPVSDRGEPPAPRYLPSRLIINDLNGDGQNELVVMKNKDIAGKHLERFRLFTKTKIIGLSWDGAGMAETWQTRELSGRVADLAVGDLENDGRPDLVVVLVAKEGQFVGTKPKVNIIAYPL